MEFCDLVKRFGSFLSGENWVKCVPFLLPWKEEDVSSIS